MIFLINVHASKGKGPNFEDLFAPNRKIGINDLEDVNIEVWVDFFQYKFLIIVQYFYILVDVRSNVLPKGHILIRFIFFPSKPEIFLFSLCNSIRKNFDLLIKLDKFIRNRTQ